MQSIRQHRRFGHRVRRQYERNRTKPEIVDASTAESDSAACSSPETADCSTAETTADEEQDLGARDPEKGKQAPEGPDAIFAKDGEGVAAERDRQLTHATTQKTIGTALGTALTGIHVRDRMTKEGGEGKVFVVGYEGDDDEMNPHNWSQVTRLGATLIIAWIAWIVGFASSVDSAALRQASQDFGVSEVTESLATGIFLIGFGVGALFAGPISETVGRNPVYVATLSLYMIFIMAAGLAPNIGGQLAFRFIAGCFAATPLTCAGGSLSDLWSPMERLYAFPMFASSAFLGPIFGPVVGGFIGESHRVSWRWTEWITLIISGMVLSLVVLFQPETYAPILLKWKAAQLRQLTGDDRYRAEIEIRDVKFLQRLGRALYRPFLLTFSEPIIVLVALYLTVIYIVLFTFLNGYTFVFAETYGFSEGITGLSFIGIGIGIFSTSALVPLIYAWARKELVQIKKEGGSRLSPEFDLWFAMLGAPAVPISLFWMGWTAYPWISYWSPLGASVLFGYGILCVFITSYLYIIDSYETYAASALSSVTLIRYMAAGGMVEVAIPFYKNLGVHWTLTILGCLSALLVPVPYLFYFHGPKIRARSKYAVP